MVVKHLYSCPFPPAALLLVVGHQRVAQVQHRVAFVLILHLPAQIVDRIPLKPYQPLGFVGAKQLEQPLLNLSSLLLSSSTCATSFCTSSIGTISTCCICMFLN